MKARGKASANASAPAAGGVGGPASPVLVRLPDAAALQDVFRRRYGSNGALGWGPALRRAHGYHTPDETYEALVAGLVQRGTRWLDAGCGRDLFPGNPALAKALAARCARLVGVDPDPTLQENPFIHERVAVPLDVYDGAGMFDVVTLRMVAEHVEKPDRCAAAIARALRPGGVAVVYTVFSFSPMPLLTRLLPLRLRHRVKRWLWGTQPKDTFPTRFKMNTRRSLRAQFAAAGMREEAFLRLDDCRTFARFRRLAELELELRRACRAVRLPYPEQCLLGVYRKP